MSMQNNQYKEVDKSMENGGNVKIECVQGDITARQVLMQSLMLLTLSSYRGEV